ncbi:hypothetical protein [Oceaniferula spumae]
MAQNSHGFWPEQKIAIRKKLKEISLRNNESLLETCSRMIPDNSNKQEKFKTVVHLISCFEDGKLKLELISKHTTGKDTESLLQGLNKSLLKRGKVDEAKDVYEQLPPGKSRVNWSSSVYVHILKENGASQATEWLTDLDFPEEKTAALGHLISALYQFENLKITETEKQAIESLASELSLPGYAERLEKALDKR